MGESPESQNEDKNERSLRKNKKNYENLRKKEESGTLAHRDCEAGYAPGLRCLNKVFPVHVASVQKRYIRSSKEDTEDQRKLYNA